MAVQAFALDATGTQRIQVHWTPDSPSVTILLNNSPVGSLDTLEERTTGKELLLPNYARLHIRFENDKPVAFLNGSPLAPLADSTASDPKPPRKRSGCLTTILIFILVVNAIATLSYFYTVFQLLAQGNYQLPPLLLLAFVLIGCLSIVGVVGICLMLVWKKWGFYLVAGCVLANIVLSFLLQAVDIRTFIPPVLVIGLYVWLNRSNVWDMMS